MLLHGPDLHGRGLGPQEDLGILGEIEGVRPVTGGVAFVDVQLREVIFRKLDLGAVEYLKAHADEYILELVEDVVHRVLVPHAYILARQRHVDGFALELELHHRGRKLLTALVYRFFDLAPELVCQLPHRGALLSREAAHLAQYRRQLALFAEVPDAHRLKALRTVAIQNFLYR